MTDTHKSTFFVEFVCQTSIILSSELASLQAKFSHAPTRGTHPLTSESILQALTPNTLFVNLTVLGVPN